MYRLPGLLKDRLIIRTVTIVEYLNDNFVVHQPRMPDVNSCFAKVSESGEELEGQSPIFSRQGIGTY